MRAAQKTGMAAFMSILLICGFVQAQDSGGSQNQDQGSNGRSRGRDGDRGRGRDGRDGFRGWGGPGGPGGPGRGFGNVNITPEERERFERRRTLYDVVESACAFFEAELRTPAGRAARDYFAGRGLDEDAVARFRLGYAPTDGTRLLKHLRAAGFRPVCLSRGFTNPTSHEVIQVDGLFLRGGG